MGATAARATPDWGILVGAQINGSGGGTASIGTGNYTGGGPIDSRTAVAVGVGAASAHVDLATGTAGVSSPYVISGSSVTLGNSSATWDDTAKFTALEFTFGMPLPVSLDLEGSIGLAGILSAALDITYVDMSGHTVTSSVRETVDSSGVIFTSTSEWVSSGLSSRGSIFFDPAYSVHIFFSMQCNYECSFADTATFNWSLPSGVSYTSASGVLLSATTAVAEPSAGTLLVVPIVGLAILARRPRREQQCA